MIQHPLGEELYIVEKPGRYMGGELNSVVKEIKKDTLRFALFYPEIYEVGMSNFGLRIIYHVLNSIDKVYAERVFLPWVDAIEFMKQNHIPLFTLETYTPLNQMDVIGFSLHTELNYTNILMGLELSGIPLRREDRNESHPLVIVGGPASLNPLPLAPFVDFFVVGDGEEVVKELIPPLQAYKNREIKRHELYKELTGIKGVFVPELGNTTLKRIAPFKQEYFPVAQIVPSIDIVHNRYVIEIMRGCTRGCRFCQGGFTYRPTRLRMPEEIIELAKKGIQLTGYEDIGFLAFTSSDYPYLIETIKWIRKELQDTFVSLPSLPIDAIEENMLKELRGLRRFSITLAPEVVTEKLRKVINKNVPLELIYRSIELAERYKYPHVKLYFMIGVPEEEEEDIHALIDFLKDIEKKFRRLRFKAAISPFVPRPHTPFQWVDQELPERSLEKIRQIKDAFRKSKRMQITYHNPYMSFLEGVFGRGDEKLAQVLEIAYRNGAIFDSRKEFFDFSKYEKAFHTSGINPYKYTRKRSLEESLPWEVINTGIFKPFLLKEYKKSLKMVMTPDCMKEKCLGCGVWFREGYELCRKGIRKDKEYQIELEEKKPADYYRYLLTYAFGEKFRFLSQRDIARIIIHILRKSGLRLRYSEGFVPRPHISLPNPLPLGFESDEELLYFETIEKLNRDKILQVLNKNSPGGLVFKKIEEVFSKPDWTKYSKSIVEFDIFRIPDIKGIQTNLENATIKGNKISFVFDFGKGGILKALQNATGLDKDSVRKLHFRKKRIVVKD